MSNKKIEAIDPITPPPNRPSHVLFGDIVGNSLCLPNARPVKYAPASFSQSIINIPKSILGNDPFLYIIPMLIIKGKAI